MGADRHINKAKQKLLEHIDVNFSLHADANGLRTRRYSKIVLPKREITK